VSVAEIVGYVVIVSICVMLVAGSVAAACGAVQMLLNRHANAVEARVRREIGTALACDAWWFGEVPAAQEVLRLYGRTLAEGLGTDANQLRDRWRATLTVAGGE
jgi:hypothetical protein